ncbi:MAG: hypothetical protein JNL25_14115 [Rhodospirillaceae bacterium]|nr:hypothetical protein [Rhodospirillaceae bacterium]
MKIRDFSQVVNGFVAALLLSACADSKQNAPQTVTAPAPVVVETTPPPQPVLPILKPGTKTRAPAKPWVEAPAEGGLPAAVQGDADAQSAADAQAEAAIDDALETPVLIGPVTGLPTFVPAEPEPVAAGSPDELRGQTEIQVMAALGSPVATRAEGTGTVWTYRAEDCSLDVYFFLDVADNQRRALSYELTTSQPGAGVNERCYTALKRASAAR